MDERKFYSLSKEEQASLSSDFRKTVHDGEIVFIDDKTAKSLTAEEAKEQLLNQRNELLLSLGYATPNDANNANNEEMSNDYPRRSR